MGKCSSKRFEPIIYGIFVSQQQRLIKLIAFTTKPPCLCENFHPKSHYFAKCESVFTLKNFSFSKPLV